VKARLFRGDGFGDERSRREAFDPIAEGVGWHRRYKEDAGEPHFDMTLQTDLEPLSKLQGGNVYPEGAISTEEI
jgi:hypothetical protein